MTIGRISIAWADPPWFGFERPEGAWGMVWLWVLGLGFVELRLHARWRR